MLKKSSNKSHMAAKSSAAPASPLGRKSAPSVISADMNVLGNIISDGFLDIDGKVEGNVKCDSVTIRANGRVKGDVLADSVQVYGRVEGLVKAKSVSLFNSAHVTGVIMHESLSIEDGAFIDGKLKRTDKVFIDDDADQDTSAQHDDLGNSMDENVLENLRLISA